MAVAPDTGGSILDREAVGGMVPVAQVDPDGPDSLPDYRGKFAQVDMKFVQ
jgi:hypothetical protein